MINVRMISMLGLTFVIGAGLGAAIVFLGTPNLYSLLEKHENVMAGVGLQPNIEALFRLKENNLLEAQVILESAVNLNVALLNDPLSKDVDSPVQRALRRAAEYRAKYPYRSGSALMDDSVQNILGKRTVKQQ